MKTYRDRNRKPLALSRTPILGKIACFADIDGSFTIGKRTHPMQGQIDLSRPGMRGKDNPCRDVRSGIQFANCDNWK